MVSTSELNKELEEAIHYNNRYNDESERLEDNKSKLRLALINVESLKEKIKRQEVSFKGLELKDDSIIREKIEGAEESNEIFRANERNKIADEKCNQEIYVYEDQTTAIRKLRESKDQALRKAKFPLPELKVTTTGTFFNDIPIKQLSSSENMKVAMSIAMALNEKFKVILVKEASLLDKENLKVIREMAKDNGYQVWLECVKDSGEMGFYFVEGEIESINGKKVKKGGGY